MAWFSQNEIRPVLGIPSDKPMVDILTVGYPDESLRPLPRKDFEEIVHYENL